MTFFHYTSRHCVVHSMYCFFKTITSEIRWNWVFIVRLTLSINNLMSKLDCMKVEMHMVWNACEYSCSIFNHRLLLSFCSEFLWVLFLFRQYNQNLAIVVATNLILCTKLCEKHRWIKNKQLQLVMDQVIDRYQSCFLLWMNEMKILLIWNLRINQNKCIWLYENLVRVICKIFDYSFFVVDL